MKKSYIFLLISFLSFVLATFTSKIGALSLDKTLFMFISYSLGCIFALVQFTPNRKRIDKRVKKLSMKFGITIGFVNFFAFLSLLTALAIAPGAIVFPLVGLSTAGIVLIVIPLFKEKINWRIVLGLILALLAGWLLR